MRRWRLLTLLLVVAIMTYTYAVSSEPQTFRGKVVEVADGDTISVERDGKDEKVRLNGIDCPETAQHFGQRAKSLTSGLCLGETVTIKVVTKDQYDRSVAEVTLPDGKSLNQELVRTGLAWWYEEYAREDKTLRDLQAEAQKAKRGLWAEKNPVAPWTYRHTAERAATPRDLAKGATAGAPPASETIKNALNAKVTLQRPYPTTRDGERTDKIAIQYAVIELVTQAGLRYNWEKSYRNTNPICRRFIKPDIQDEKCSDALQRILDPEGLRYTVVDGEIVLEKK